MFKELLDRIRNSKQTKTVTQDIKKEDDSKIILTKNDDILKMSIIGRPSLHTFFKKVDELPEEEQNIILKLPLNILANSNQEVNPGNYLWTTIENIKYTIISNKKTISINQTKKLSDVIEEINFSIDTMTNAFTVYRAIHDNNYSTIEHKRFDSNGNSLPSDLVLSPEEAKEELDLLFDDLIHQEKVLAELDGVIEIENLKTIIDNYFSNIISNSPRK